MPYKTGNNNNRSLNLNSMNSRRYKDMGLFRFALNVEYFLKCDY